MVPFLPKKKKKKVNPQMEQISVQHNVYRMNHRNNLVFLLILFLLLGNRLYYRNKKKTFSSD